MGCTEVQPFRFSFYQIATDRLLERLARVWPSRSFARMAVLLSARMPALSSARMLWARMHVAEATCTGLLSAEVL